MTINVESPSKMVLQDLKRGRFLVAGILLPAGLLIACLFGRHNIVPIIVGLAFMGAGAFFLFSTKRVTITLDNAAGKITVLLQGIKSKTERELRVAQIKKFVLRKFMETHATHTAAQRWERNQRTKTTTTTYFQYVLVFVTDQNEELPFAFGRVPVGATDLDGNKQQEAERVAAFIGVPLEVSLPADSSVMSALKAGLAGKMEKTL
jgi:hypothetical protein